MVQTGCTGVPKYNTFLSSIISLNSIRTLCLKTWMTSLQGKPGKMWTDKGEFHVQYSFSRIDQQKRRAMLLKPLWNSVTDDWHLCCKFSSREVVPKCLTMSCTVLFIEFSLHCIRKCTTWRICLLVKHTYQGKLAILPAGSHSIQRWDSDVFPQAARREKNPFRRSRHVWSILISPE